MSGNSPAVLLFLLNNGNIQRFAGTLQAGTAVHDGGGDGEDDGQHQGDDEGAADKFPGFCCEVAIAMTNDGPEDQGGEPYADDQCFDIQTKAHEVQHEEIEQGSIAGEDGPGGAKHGFFGIGEKNTAHDGKGQSQQSADDEAAEG